MNPIAAGAVVQQSSGKATQIVIVLIVVGVLVVGGIVVSKVLQGLNIVDTKDERRDERLIASSENAKFFKGGYRKAGQELQTPGQVKDQSKQIYDSVGYLYDSPEKMLGAIKQTKNGSQVSYLVDQFYNDYKKDLFGYLKERMDTEAQKDALAQAIKHVNSLK